jgi:UDP:flavonoid glycosyltransferase YjiC (YdhE family)
MRTLFAWELGWNFGHLQKDIAIAVQLRAAGHDVQFLCHDLRTADEMLTPLGFSFERIPHHPPSHEAISRGGMCTHSDLLRTLWGNASVPVLKHLAVMWNERLASRRIDAVVSDFAPTAVFGSITASVPAVLVGTGWEIPPAVSPLPWMAEDGSAPDVRSNERESQLLDCMNYVLHMFDRPALKMVSHLYAGKHTFLTTFPELDHYCPRSDVAYVGDLGIESGRKSVAWMRDDPQKILAYLRRSTPDLETILLALGEVDAEVVCICPDIDDALAERVRSTITIVRESVRLPALLATCSAVVTYGGAGLVAAALRSGVPLLFVSPQWNERKRTARRAMELGVALRVDGPAAVADYAGALLDLMNASKGFRSRARAFQSRHSSVSPAASSEMVAKAIAALA